MSDAPDDKVTKLPVRFKNRDPDKFLRIVRKYDGCNHRNGPFLVAEKEAEVECGECGAKLSPLWVLMHMATQETHYHAARDRYFEEMKRLNERSRTKCQHCGEMTRISGR